MVISEEGENALAMALKKMKEKYGDEFMITGVNEMSVEDYIKKNEERNKKEKK